MIDETTGDSSSPPEDDPVGEMRISSAKRVGNRVTALGGVALGIGMITAMTLMDHTTVSVPPP